MGLITDKTQYAIIRKSRYVLFKLFPTLPNPENLFKEPEQQRLFRLAKKCVSGELE